MHVHLNIEADTRHAQIIIRKPIEKNLGAESAIFGIIWDEELGASYEVRISWELTGQFWRRAVANFRGFVYSDFRETRDSLVESQLTNSADVPRIVENEDKTFRIVNLYGAEVGELQEILAKSSGFARKYILVGFAAREFRLAAKEDSN